MLAAATLAVDVGMAVLIWLVQLVVYPAFAAVRSERFVEWHAGYTRAITWIVGPLMLGQAALHAVALLRGSSVAAVLAVALIAVAWVATGTLAVPCHRRLERGFDETAWRRLLRTNWIRTAAWSLVPLLTAADQSLAIS